MAFAVSGALIFDMDGVIVDSMPVHTAAWRVYLRRLGIECNDIERRMHGLRNDDIVVDFIDPHLKPGEILAHGAAKEALYREMVADELESRLVPGIRQFLARHKGGRLAVASNAEPANVEFVLERAGLREYFRVVVDGMQVRNPKPFPDIYLRTADLLGIEPGNCVVFEDSPAGVQAARAAGARVVGVETHSPLEGVDCRIVNFLDPQLEQWLSHQDPGRG